MKHIAVQLMVAALVLAVLGCGGNGGSAGGNSKFDSFKQMFSGAELPIGIKGCYVDPLKYKELAIEKYPQFVTDSDNEYTYCTFKGNGDYIPIITLGPADCFFPILTTYTKEGKMIDKRNIAIGGCGADCGFTCEEYMTIRSDYSIYVSDTITEFKCDTLGNVIPGTKEHFVIYKQGKLLSSGKIALSGNTRDALKD